MKNEQQEKTMHSAACHCGAVQFNVRLNDGFASNRRCTCSICRMRGAVAVSVDLDEMEIVKGQACLSLYQFNTNTAKHYFCSTCGIYTHHQRRSNPNQYGVNVACLVGVSPFDFSEVIVMDGVHHSSDTNTGTTIAGVLRYSRT